MSARGPIRSATGDARPTVVNVVFDWVNGVLVPRERCEVAAHAVLAADSWLVDHGKVLALELHRERFRHAVEIANATVDLDGFWTAMLERTETSGVWFPRVELQSHSGAAQLVYRHRSAPERRRSTVLAVPGVPDPRTRPQVKGPDLTAMSRLRTAVQPLGADEAVICSPEGYVVEGAYSALLWWRGDVLCVPSRELDRIDSVTARSVIALAVALGIEVREESSTPSQLDGLEIWALSALHGIRIVTGWVDGPRTAELPGRLRAWQDRLGRLSRQVDTLKL